MPVIIGKNKEDIIKTLKKLGEIVVVAKAEVLYAFKKRFFPNQTIEQVMEEIKKSPKGYKYYQVGDIKITEISETKDETKKCDHLLDYEETHCTICNKPVWLFDNEHVLERISIVENTLQDVMDKLTMLEKKLDIGKIPISDDLMKRIMSHKLVPMDKSKEKTEKRESFLPENYYSGGEKSVCKGSDTLGVNKDGSPINSKLPKVRDRMERFKLGMTEEEYGKYKKGENWVYQEEKADPEEGTVFGTGSLSDQHEFEEKEKWGDKKEKKD